MSDEDEALKAAKIQRRSAKTSLTRLGNALVQLCDNKRPVNEVSEYLVTPPARRAWRSYKFAPFLFFFPCRKSADRSWVIPLCIV